MPTAAGQALRRLVLVELGLIVAAVAAWATLDTAGRGLLLGLTLGVCVLRLATWALHLRRLARQPAAVELDPPSSLAELQAQLEARSEELEQLRTREKLRRAHIHRATIEVASASAEIDASTRAQVQAAHDQVDGVSEVSSAMQRLAGSSQRVTEAAAEQLEHAEQARVRADEVAGRTAELRTSIEKIADSLAQISEVAARSDILALNGSLEATRAGEAGRGFALVAAEMRRLAERIGATAAQVRAALDEVATAHGETVAATAASRTFAERSAEVAGQIHDVARTQSAETKLITLSVGEIAEGATQAEAALAQTRAATDALHVQAQHLARLLEGFAEDQE